MSKKAKIALTVIASILFIFCLAIDIGYIYIKYFSGEKKLVSSTFNLSFQTLADGETQKPFIEVKYYSNAKKNGIELLDVKYNYYMDESKESFYSQGVQYYGTDTRSISEDFTWFVKDTKQDDDFTVKKKKSWGDHNIYYKWWGRFTPSNMEAYQSYDDYNTTSLSTNPVDSDTFFKIEIDDQIYGLKFKSNYHIMGTDNYLGREKLYTKSYLVVYKHYWADYYAYYDYSYFNKLLFNSIKSMSPGTDQYVVFEFGDLFDYYVYNDNVYTLVVKESYYDQAKKYNTGTSIIKDSTGLIDKVSKEVKSYFAIKVSISEDGAQRASDSMFHMIKGSGNYVVPGLTEEVENYDDYYIGRSIIDLSLDDFEMAIINDSCYLSLRQATRDKWYDYRDKIKLRASFKRVINGTYYSGYDLESLKDFVYEIDFNLDKGGEE